MSSSERTIKMGVQPSSLCFGATQRLEPTNYSRPNLRSQLERQRSGEEVRSLLQLRGKLLIEARERGDDDEVRRLTGLGVWDDVLPRQESYAWKVTEEMRVLKKEEAVLAKKQEVFARNTGQAIGKQKENSKEEGMGDTMKALPEVPREADPRRRKSGLTLHRNEHICVESADFEIVDPVTIGTSIRAKTSSKMPAPQAKKEGVFKYRAYVPPSSSTSSATKISETVDMRSDDAESSGTTADTLVDDDDFDPFIEHADFFLPAVPPRSPRRSRGMTEGQSLQRHFSSPSTVALVPSPLFSRTLAPLAETEGTEKVTEMVMEMEITSGLTSVQLIRDMQALEDYRAGMFDPGEFELGILWERVREGVDRGLIAI